MAEFKEILTKDFRVQKETSQTFEKHKKEPYSTQSKKRQNALIHSEVFD